MAIYNSSSMWGEGVLGEYLSASIEYKFSLTNRVSKGAGSEYFIMDGLDENTIVTGSITNYINIESSSYLEGVPQNNVWGLSFSNPSSSLTSSDYETGSFVFTPTQVIPASEYYLRSTGNYSLDISPVSVPYVWSPEDEGAGLIMWYKNKTLVHYSGGSADAWGNSSGNAGAAYYDLEQLTIAEMPLYDEDTGELEFDSGDDSNLQLSGSNNAPFTAKFTIGMRINPNTTNGVLIGSNTGSGELFKISSASRISLQIDGSAGTLNLDSPNVYGEGDYIVLYRLDTDIVYQIWNGVLQVDTANKAGTLDINALGIRYNTQNGYTGGMFEAQVYKTASIDLAISCSNYLANVQPI